MEQTEREDLLAAVKDYYRRKTRRNLRAAGAGIAGTAVGFASGDPSAGIAMAEKMMPQGYGPQGSGLTEQERLAAKAKILELATARAKALTDAREGSIDKLLEAGKAQDDLVKYGVEAFGDAVGADAQIKSARDSAVASLGGKALDQMTKMWELEFGGSDPGRRARFEEAMTSAKEFALVKNENNPIVMQRVIDNWSQLFVNNSSINERATLVAVLQQTLAEKQVGLADFKNMLRDSNMVGASQLYEAIVNNEKVAMDILVGAATESKEATDAYFGQLSGKSALGTEDLKAYLKAVRDGATGGITPEQMVKTLTDQMDKMGQPGTLDPASQKQFADALDELDPESETYNPTLEMVRNDLFKRPDFQEYMAKTGITDPMVALRQLKREARGAHRASVQQSQQAALARNQQLREGAADPTMTGAPAKPGEGPGQARTGNIQAAAMATNPQALDNKAKAQVFGNTYAPLATAAGRALNPSMKRLKDKFRKKKPEDTTPPG